MVINSHAHLFNFRALNTKRTRQTLVNRLIKEKWPEYMVRIVQKVFDEHRVHAGIDGDLPNRRADEIEPGIASLESYSRESRCNGLFQMPKAD